MRARSRLVVIDVETSGVNPLVHDVWSIAMVPMAAEISPLVLYVKPETEIRWSKFALQNFQANGREWFARAISPVDVCNRIDEYLGSVFGPIQATPVGHNIGFDLSFIKRVAYQGGRESIRGLGHRAIDTHTMLYLLFLQGRLPETALTSDGALHYFEIDVPKAGRHTALGDAVATRLLAEKLFELLVADECLDHEGR